MVETTYIIPGAPYFALLTDTHNTDPTPVLASLASHRPDLILLAGDFVYAETPKNGRLKMEESAHAMQLLKGCAEIAQTFVSLGNHEWMLSDPDLRMIRSVGCKVLDNACTAVTVNGREVTVGGLTSARVTEYKRFREGSTELYPRPVNRTAATSLAPETGADWLRSFSSAPGFRILLCHHPEYYPLLPGSVDLIVSGHAHGGQWRVYNPFRKNWTGVFAPGQGLWPQWTRGVYDGRLIVSAGLSNTTLVPRINNPTEIVYVRGRREE